MLPFLHVSSQGHWRDVTVASSMWQGYPCCCSTLSCSLALTASFRAWQYLSKVLPSIPSFSLASTKSTPVHAFSRSSHSLSNMPKEIWSPGMHTCKSKYHCLLKVSICCFTFSRGMSKMMSLLNSLAFFNSPPPFSRKS